MLRLLLLTLVTGGAPAPATVPGFMDTARLIAMCNAEGPDAAAGKSICLGYVAGAADQMLAQQARREAYRRTICPPKSISVSDTVAAVVKYSRFATTAHGVGAASFVQFALEDTYPCQVRGVGQ